jgi:glycerophosphoryl diester phosphodiesterase
VLVWTVNSAADVDLCCRAGVDAVITDRPRAVRELLEARRDQAG